MNDCEDVDDVVTRKNQYQIFFSFEKIQKKIPFQLRDMLYDSLEH